MKNKNPSLPIGLLRRLTVMFYDAILLIAVLFFASILISVPFDITYDGNLNLKYILYITYIYLVAFLFFGWCWTHGGQTLGLKTWKIKLVSNSGANISWKDAFLRYLGSLLCWFSCGIGFIWCYTNKERLAWNDIISGTRLQQINGQT